MKYHCQYILQQCSKLCHPAAVRQLSIPYTDLATTVGLGNAQLIQVTRRCNSGYFDFASASGHQGTECVWYLFDYDVGLNALGLINAFRLKFINHSTLFLHYSLTDVSQHYYSHLIRYQFCCNQIKVQYLCASTPCDPHTQKKQRHKTRQQPDMRLKLNAQARVIKHGPPATFLACRNVHSQASTYQG